MNLLTAANIISGVACGMIREASIGPSFCGVSKSSFDILMNFLYHFFHSRLSISTSYSFANTSQSFLSKQGRNPDGFCTLVELVEKRCKPAYQNEVFKIPAYCRENLIQELSFFYRRGINQACLFSNIFERMFS